MGGMAVRPRPAKRVLPVAAAAPEKPLEFWDVQHVCDVSLPGVWGDVWGDVMTGVSRRSLAALLFCPDR